MQLYNSVEVCCGFIRNDIGLEAKIIYFFPVVAWKRFLVRLHFRVLPRSALSRIFVDCAPAASADEHMRANSAACPVKYDKTSSRRTHPTSVLCVGRPLVNRCCCFTRYNVNRLCMNVSGFKIAHDVGVTRTRTTGGQHPDGRRAFAACKTARFPPQVRIGREGKGEG